MAIDLQKIDALGVEELRAVYGISRIVLQTADSITALQEIIRLSRPVFIFDNIVIYQIRDGQTLEPTYARSVGRGRSAEADMAWGEAVAHEVMDTQQKVIRSEEIGKKLDDRMLDRLRLRDYLGLPLEINDQQVGALVFIRFGGPPYLPEQIDLATFIAEHVTQLLERQHLIEQIVRLEAEHRFDRLQEDFVATVSHDLRSPLGFIKGYATSLLREDAKWDPGTRREFLTIIDEEADRLAALIDNLLDSSRLQSGTLKMDFQPIRLEALLVDAAQRAEVRKYNIKLHLDFSPTQNRVWGDPIRLMQVFDNLLTNANKYAPGSDVTIGLVWESDFAHILVSDTGPGIQPEHLNHIFKRFYRVSKDSGPERGTGLGLYICQEIIHAHQGEIVAQSELGMGTSIHIRLPRTKPPQANQENLP
ncbi:MAG: sensor histidine kinase [Anaerolineales bacterium]|jgi:signal transduction histidine kinase